MDVLSMEWRDMLFAHWPFDPAVVGRALPDGLDPHTREGEAWVGIVAHRMADVRPRGAPFGRSFVEVNLRTYVRQGDHAGVYFFSLDAGDPLAVGIARRLWGLPYFRADSRIVRSGDRYRVTSHRTHPGVPGSRFVARYGPTDAVDAPEAGSIAAFLTDRYRLFTPSRVGMVTARLRRSPLPVAPATLDVEAETVFAASDLPAPDGEPHVLFGAPDGIRVRAGPPARAR
jgi:hypothetical protein